MKPKTRIQAFENRWRRFFHQQTKRNQALINKKLLHTMAEGAVKALNRKTHKENFAKLAIEGLRQFNYAHPGNLNRKMYTNMAKRIAGRIYDYLINEKPLKEIIEG